MGVSRRALSFSGGGHLLVYHLGVLSRLRAAGITDGVSCYAGSSGGAIAAVAAVCIADVDHFATEFALKGESRRGLEQMLPADSDVVRLTTGGRLGIAVTKCQTGESVLIRGFGSRESLLRAVQASCLIPPSFHPLEFFSFSEPRETACRSRFDDSEGVRLEGLEGAFVDGGLSANIPLVPGHDTLRVSVLACPGERGLIANNHSSSLRLPGWVYMSGLRVRLSLSNLRAGLAAVAATRGELGHFYERGCADAEAFLASDRSWIHKSS